MVTKLCDTARRLEFNHPVGQTATMTLLPFTPHGPDVQCVLAAARLLNVREYRVFELARGRQRGAPAEAADIAPAFMRYLKQRDVPTWAQTFSVEVVESARSGNFDPQAFGGERSPTRVSGPPRFQIANMAIFAFAASLSWLMVKFGAI